MSLDGRVEICHLLSSAASGQKLGEGTAVPHLPTDTPPLLLTPSLPSEFGVIPAWVVGVSLPYLPQPCLCLGRWDGEKGVHVRGLC